VPWYSKVNLQNGIFSAWQISHPWAAGDLFAQLKISVCEQKARVMTRSDAEPGIISGSAADFARYHHHTVHVTPVQNPERRGLVVATFVGAYNGRTLTISFGDFGPDLYFTNPLCAPWTEGHDSYEPRLFFNPYNFEHYYAMRDVLGPPFVQRIWEHRNGGEFEVPVNWWLHMTSTFRRMNPLAEQRTFRRA
jgi:hypothetical protein